MAATSVLRPSGPDRRRVQHGSEVKVALGQISDLVTLRSSLRCVPRRIRWVIATHGGHGFYTSPHRLFQSGIAYRLEALTQARASWRRQGARGLGRWNCLACVQDGHFLRSMRTTRNGEEVLASRSCNVARNFDRGLSRRGHEVICSGRLARLSWTSWTFGELLVTNT